MGRIEDLLIPVDLGDQDDAENPFALPNVSEEWVSSVEGEKDLWRDRVLYPAMRTWISEFSVKEPIIVDVGAGQGRSSTEIDGYGAYIGVEPSSFLVERAIELYAASRRYFVRGSAYRLPLVDGAADGVIAVNVLFHLARLEDAVKEIARVLKPGGKFFINTADNDALEIWKSLYTNLQIDEAKMQGAIRTPVRGLSLNTFYFQPNQYVIDLLDRHGLRVRRIAKSCEKDGHTLFITLEGEKT